MLFFKKGKCVEVKGQLSNKRMTCKFNTRDALIDQSISCQFLKMVASEECKKWVSFAEVL